MKKLMLAITLLTLSHTSISQEIFRIDSTSTGGLCLKGFAQNDRDRFCIKPPDALGRRIISKPKPSTGCVYPWTASGTQCIAVLKVAKL